MSKKKFIKTYEKYARDIFRFIYLKTGSKETAQDLNAKVFLKLWKYAHKEDHKIKQPRAFLYKLARNQVIDYYRRHKEAHLDELEYDIPDRPKFKKAIQVQQLINKLKPSYQDIVTLYYIEGMEAKEVAQVLDLSVGAVRGRLHRALKKLKKMTKKAEK